MIRVNSQGSRALGTGKNVNGTASTFMAEGPKDALSAIDAYEGSLPNATPSDSVARAAAEGSAVASEAVAGTNGSGSIASRLTASGGTSERVTATLWEALLCGNVRPDPENSGSQRARMGRTAMFLRSTGCGAEDLIGLLAIKGGQAGINNEELQRRMDGALNDSIAVLDEEERDNLVALLAESTGADAGQIRARVNGSQETVDVPAERSNDVRALSQLVGQYTDSPELITLFDKAAESAVIESLLGKSIDLGLPQAFVAIMDKIDDDELKTASGLKRLRQAAIVSDLQTVRAIVDQAGASRSLAKVPDLITVITGSYRWPVATRTSDYPAKRDELIATLEAIDINWALKKRNGVYVDDLEPFSVATDQAKTLFKESSYAAQAMIAKPYYEVDYRNVTRKYHPYAIDFSQTA